MSTISDTDLLPRFESGQVSPVEWNHQAHVRAAYLLLRRFPIEHTLERMRTGLTNLNAVHHVPDEPERGYHETLTCAWLRLIEHTLRTRGAEADSLKFCEENPHLLQRSLIRLFYSRARIVAPLAKREFVEPDLMPLPPRPSSI